MNYCSVISIYIKEKKEVLKQIIKGAIAEDDNYEPDDYEIRKDKNENHILYIRYDTRPWNNNKTLTKYWTNILGQLDIMNYLFIREGDDLNDIDIAGDLGKVIHKYRLEIDIDFN